MNYKIPVLKNSRSHLSMAVLIGCFIFYFFSNLANATTSIITPLALNQAFQFNARVIDSKTVNVNINIAPHYYLYQEHLRFHLTPASVKLGRIIAPPSNAKHDDILGHYQVYEGKLTFTLPLLTGGKLINLRIDYQGCSSDGFCYPPSSLNFSLNLSLAAQTQQTPSVGNDLPSLQASSLSEQDRITTLLAKQNLGLIIISFLGFGLLLAFTPCVLPMIPILSGIIVGQSQTVNFKRALILSLLYVLGMSSTYALAGVFAGFAGESIQSAMQKPWIIASFSALFVLLALSLFGFFEIALPHFLQQRLQRWNKHHQSGSYCGAVAMGVLATLIVSPCVTPPLIGALSYIGQTGNALLGGIALFSLGVGMGIPLILIGIGGGKILPKAGQWMNTIKHVFGVLMLGIAIQLLSRIIANEIILILWAGLCIISAVFLGALDFHPASSLQRFWKGIGLILLIYGIILMIGATSGARDPLHPLEKLTHNTLNTSVKQNTISSSEEDLFTRIKNHAELTLALNAAKIANQPVLIDFTASWCIACQELAEKTFAEHQVQMAWQRFKRLQIDVSANSPEDKLIQKQFNVLAPPTLLFFNSKGILEKSLSLVGFVKANALIDSLTNTK